MYVISCYRLILSDQNLIYIVHRKFPPYAQSLYVPLVEGMSTNHGSIQFWQQTIRLETRIPFNLLPSGRSQRGIQWKSSLATAHRSLRQGADPCLRVLPNRFAHVSKELPRNVRSIKKINSPRRWPSSL